MNYLDVSAIWEVTEQFTLRAGSTNVLDKDPPIVATEISGTGSANTYPTYDTLGRQIFLRRHGAVLRGKARAPLRRRARHRCQPDRLRDEPVSFVPAWRLRGSRPLLDGGISPSCCMIES